MRWIVKSDSRDRQRQRAQFTKAHVPISGSKRVQVSSRYPERTQSSSIVYQSPTVINAARSCIELLRDLLYLMREHQF